MTFTVWYRSRAVLITGNQTIKHLQQTATIMQYIWRQTMNSYAPIDNIVPVLLFPQNHEQQSDLYRKNELAVCRHYIKYTLKLK